MVFLHYLNVNSTKAEALAVFLVLYLQALAQCLGRHLEDTKYLMLLYLCSRFCQEAEYSLAHPPTELFILHVVSSDVSCDIGFNL